MLKRIGLLAAASMIAFGASAFTAPTPAEAGGRFVYSGNGVYLSFGHAPRRQYRKHRKFRKARRCRPAYRWVTRWKPHYGWVQYRVRSGYVCGGRRHW